MTEFREGAKIRREVRVHGVDKPVQVEMTEHGISMWVKGSRKRVSATWTGIARSSTTGADVPSYLMDKPIELLQYQAKAK